MSTGIHGYGAVLKMGSAASTVSTITNISSITGPNQSREAIDISTLASGTITKEAIPGMVDPGEITFELNYNEAEGLILTGTTYGINQHYPAFFEVEFPDTTATTQSSNFTGSGFVTALGHALDTGSKISQSVTLKLTGPITYGTT